MSKKPPLLPSEVLRRTLRTARFDGTSVLALSGLFAIISATAQDQIGTIVGVIVAGAGAIELHGAGLLKNNETRGMKWLVVSQLALLVTIVGYAEFKLRHVDLNFLHQVWSSFSADQRQQLLSAAKVSSDDDYLQGMYVTCYQLIVLLTIPFQGGMALYYLRRRQRVAAALAEG